MLLTLQPYTFPRVERPYFSDPTLFGLFAVGMVIGVALYVVALLLPLEYVLVGFLLEESIKLLIMNMPRFQRRADTPFYAFGLSAGMSATLAFGLVNRTLVQVGFDPLALVVMITYSTMLALLQIGTGTTIGMGVARGTPWPFFGQAVVVHLAFVLLLAPSGTSVDSIFGTVLFVVALAFVATYYYYVHHKLLPVYVREALAKLAEAKPAKAKKVPRSKD
jgi:hypothetical protein